jgi:hypothetical protein
LIETTLGILQYTISDTDVRNVERVYYIDGFNEKQDIPVEIDNAINPDDTVTVYFKDDPGATTDQYYYDGYVWPFNGQITSTSVPLSLPSKAQTDLLFFMVSKMLEVDKDGRSIYNNEEEDMWLKDWFTFANQGAVLEPRVPKNQGYE